MQIEDAIYNINWLWFRGINDHVVVWYIGTETMIKLNLFYTDGGICARFFNI